MEVDKGGRFAPAEAPPAADPPKAAAPAADAAIHPHGEIVGRFVDATGLPVKGATVGCNAVVNDAKKSSGTNAVTDADGRYRLLVKSPGICSVWLKNNCGSA